MKALLLVAHGSRRAASNDEVRALAKRLDDADLAIIDKRRPKANVAKVMHIIGEVEGKCCVLVDDMVDTAGTLTQAVDAILNKGALEVHACCVHPVLSGPAITSTAEDRIAGYCMALAEAGIPGAIVGKAIYEKRISLNELSRLNRR